MYLKPRKIYGDEGGASREELLKAIGVAFMMAVGPEFIYGCEALEALNQFEAGSII
jgi:alkylhydroperoxidase/carboxymuconolactone decarboxylase family protein YurZ